MNAPTILIGLIIFVLFAAIVARGIHNKRQGKGGCSCGGELFQLRLRLLRRRGGSLREIEIGSSKRRPDLKGPAFFYAFTAAPSGA